MANFSQAINSAKSRLQTLKVAVDEYLASKMKIPAKQLAEQFSPSFDEMLAELEMTEEDYVLAIRHGLQRAKVLVRRRPQDIRINQFCLRLSAAWAANTDVQFVLDAYSCAEYVVSYIGKSFRGISQLLSRASKESKNKPLKQQFRFVPLLPSTY
ncbi:MAG: hypothetical protein GY740_03605 [Gammaproteobacteria bacterium]|nr:hypothetical protein [Gammaproteobacteria bacterium]